VCQNRLWRGIAALCGALRSSFPFSQFLISCRWLSANFFQSFSQFNQFFWMEQSNYLAERANFNTVNFFQLKIWSVRSIFVLQRQLFHLMQLKIGCFSQYFFQMNAWTYEHMTAAVEYLSTSVPYGQTLSFKKKNKCCNFNVCPYGNPKSSACQCWISIYSIYKYQKTLEPNKPTRFMKSRPILVNCAKSKF
jgi:hypothetical protein